MFLVGHGSSGQFESYNTITSSLIKKISISASSFEQIWYTPILSRNVHINDRKYLNSAHAETITFVLSQK